MIQKSFTKLTDTQVILAPYLSEKANKVSEHCNQVVFKTHSNANKMDIKHAVENLFNVKVKHVTILNVKGKKKKFGKYFGQRSNWKKAYISLQPGNAIDLLPAD